MFRHLKSVISRRNNAPRPNVFDAPLAPEQSIYAIGDVHGRVDLMDRMIAQVHKDIAACKAENDAKKQSVQIVFLGDYIDRGDHSAQVLERLQDIAQDSATTCLMGNHEKMMLDFLDAPEDRGNMWLRNGGLQTLASYGIGGLTDHAKPAQLVKTRDALRAALPEQCEDWLRKLPIYWKSGNIVCVHAGMNPNLAIEAQDSQICIWGHRDFLRRPRQDGNWIVYGHIISEQAEARDGRISVDTGACFSGRLSAAVIGHESLRFLTT